jgi:hypothetical protein
VRRHAALQQLSRDHPPALAVALKARPAEALHGFLAAERCGHFADTLDLVAAGELLDAHVRLEERAIFPRIEDAMPEEALERLGQALRGR